ncbi:MAG: AmmeMemoRadiSam system protein B [Deltaproteobacteria bacterium]|nr:AmmeMemoRadiSam system protein B [Deltaproteobacteria bacterium]MBW2072738.1 AmmeMemoRadiSam system protein B [Deltaproteobacteria bacterium]
MTAELPKIRSHLEAIPVSDQGNMQVALRDLEGLSSQTLILSPQAYFILTLLDGSHSITDIQAAYMRRFGDLLFREALEGLLRTLDDNFMLDNDRSRRQKEQLINEFRQQSTRAPYHAGLTYENDPEKLRSQLLAYFSPENGGPGFPEPAHLKRPLRALVAPHIDLRAGGPCFAHAYKALLEAQPIGTCVILGTGHEPLPHYFALSRKDFDTPLGRVAADQEFIDEFSHRSPVDLFADEFAHRREHTIEFQVVFLRLLLPDVKIVPLLCSFGVEEIGEEKEEILQVVDALRQTVALDPEGTCLLASVDLAHIGPRYGDNFRPHAGTIQHHQQEDQHLLEILLTGNAHEFARVLIQDGNRRRICGLPPLYTLLKALPGRVDGKLLYYGHTQVDQHNSFVTFASAALYSQEQS